MSSENTFIQELQRRNVIRVSAAFAVGAWIILQLCDITFPALGLDDADIAYVIAVLLVIFPCVVAFCWFYEITPDGLAPTRRVNPNESISSSTGRRINQVIIGLLSIALLFFAGDYFTRDKGTVPVTNNDTKIDDKNSIAGQTDSVQDATTQVVPPQVPIASEVDPEPSIAVMPFVNMSSDTENEYFSDGLSEELLNVLAQIDGLRVAGRTSSFYYKGKNIDLRDIGRELSVDNILEGSVRKVGNKVRITAQLISAHDGFHLWSQTYDRELDDVFAIQDEISMEVASAMQLTLLTDGINLSENRQTHSAEAHDVYLQAQQLLYDRQPDSIKRSIELFRLASRLDPEYGPPIVGLANAGMIAFNNHRLMTLEESSATAEEAFKRAEALGFITSDYWASRGLYHNHLVETDSSHYALAKQAFQRALDLNPNNVDVLHWFATLTRFDEPWAMLEQENRMMTRAVQLDPHNRVIKLNYFFGFVGTKDEARGIEGLRRAAEADPDYDGYRQYLAQYNMRENRFVESAREIVKLDPDNNVGYFLRSALAYLFDDKTHGLHKKLLSSTPVSEPVYPFVRLSVLSEVASKQELVMEAKLLLNRRDLENMSSNITFALLKFNEPALVAELIENVSPEFKNDIPSHLGQRESTMLEYMVANYMMGKVDRARRMARNLLAAYDDRPYMEVFRGKGAINAYCYLVLGDINSALAEVEKMYNAGTRARRFLGFEDLAIAQPLVEMPRYQEIAGLMQAELDRQRPEVLATLGW